MYKLLPSDFKYLYEDCKHCYYQKAKGFIKELPSIGFPGVFSKMNSLLQNAIIGMDLRDINSLLPAGEDEVRRPLNPISARVFPFCLFLISRLSLEKIKNRGRMVI